MLLDIVYCILSIIFGGILIVSYVTFVQDINERMRQRKERKR
jgi:hypothetical protein